MKNSAPPDTSSKRGDPNLYFRIRAACQGVVHHLIQTVEERHRESTPSSAAAVTFDRRYATRTCLRVPIERAGAKPVSHYEYQKSVAKAWLDPDDFGQGPGYHTLSDGSSKSSTISTMSKSCGGSGR